MENKTITIKLVRSLLGRSAKQIATAKSLGLAAQVNPVTAGYIEVRQVRKLEVLQLYHETVLLPTKVTENVASIIP